jgi:hypothetical protein
VRVGDALERERLLHVDPESALFDEFDESSQGDRIGVDRDAAEAHAGRLKFGGEPRILLGDRRYQVTSWAEHCERALDGVASDLVEHEVDVADRLGEVDRRVVDHFVGAETLDELPLALAGGRDHVRAECFRDLDRDVADPTATAVDQDAVAAVTSPRSTRPCHAVSPTTGNAEASTCESDAGLRARCNAGADTTSAYALAARGNSGIPNTSSPGPNRHVCASSTTPLMSQPRMNGGLPISGNSPARSRASSGFSPIALTRTRTSVGRSWGAGASTMVSTSGPPSFCWVMTRMTLLVL